MNIKAEVSIHKHITYILIHLDSRIQKERECKQKRKRRNTIENKKILIFQLNTSDSRTKVMRTTIDHAL